MERSERKQIEHYGALVVAMIVCIMIIVLAVVGTGLYLVIHNWG